MYSRELLLVAGILLLVFLGRREHLTFTATIKDIRTGADATEANRIFQMASSSLQQKAIALNAQEQNAIDKSKTIVATIVQDFQGKVYVPATAPITEDAVTNYIAQTLPALRAVTPANPRTSFYIDAYSSGEAKRLLMTYLGLPTTSTSLAISTPPTSSTGTPSIPQVLEQMRDALLDYKMTGSASSKSSYDSLKTWMDSYVNALNTQLTKDADSITNDVATYRTANSEMSQTQTDFQAVRKEGPKLEDAYLTLKRQVNETPAPDMTGFYVKVGIAVALGIGAAVLTFV